MSEFTVATSRPPLAIAAGRSIACLVFAWFGAVWLAVGISALGRLTYPVLGMLALCALALSIVAVLLLRRCRAAGPSVARSRERKRDDRNFGILNAIQWTAIFVVAQVLGHLQHPGLICPAVVLIVGIHFFVMPPSYRSRINFAVGAAFLVVFVLGLILFKGDRIVAAEAIAAGIILWCAAIVALRTANRNLRTFFGAP